jgi:hypothetical protein
LVDEERLTMFAAPRTSAEGTNLILSKLASILPGAAISWIYLDRGLVYCFNQAAGPKRPFPGFKAGEIVSIEATALKGFEAERTPADNYSWRKTESLESLLAPIENSKGQSLGFVAATVRTGEGTASLASEIRSVVEAGRGAKAAPPAPLREAAGALA